MKLKLSRDLIVVIVLLSILVALTAYGGWLRGQGDEPSLAWDSNRAEGARALALWLQGLGYTVTPLEYQQFQPSPGVDVLFVLAPLVQFDPDELSALDRWVQRGGTLIVATDNAHVAQGQGLLTHYHVSLHSLLDVTDTLTLDQPLLVHPPVGAVNVRAEWGLTVDREGVVVHARVGDTPVLVSLAQGSGRVWLTTLGEAFNNRQLRNSGNARLILNILGESPNARKVAFDEIHHGRGGDLQTLNDWLVQNPAGWAILFAGTLLFGYVVVRGRRFGRALPAPHSLARRGPEEYILAMANLFRRGGLRDATARHYHDRLKRVLARSYRMDPSMADPDFVAELARYRDDVDQAALLKLLRALGRGGIGEADLVRLAAEVDRWERPA